MKKLGIGLLLSAFFIGLASAQPVGDLVQKTIDAITEILTPIFQTLLGQYSTADFFWTKVLLFVLLAVIIRFILFKVPQLEKNKAVVNIVSFIVALFAVRLIFWCPSD